MGRRGGEVCGFGGGGGVGGGGGGGATNGGRGTNGGIHCTKEQNTMKNFDLS